MSKKVQNYKGDVLASNKKFKEFESTFKGAAKRLIQADGVPGKYKTFLRAIIGSPELLKKAAKECRKSKNGFSPFYVLQLCYKKEKQAIQDGLKFNSKATATNLMKVA